MIQIELTKKQIEELKKFRRLNNNSSYGLHALIVLKSSQGQSVPQIAKELLLHPHTVRKWIKRYLEGGIEGLKRKFAPGKSRELREEVKEALLEVIEKSPMEEGYSVSKWTSALLVDFLKNKKGIITSHDTVERALKEAGYRYKRSAKKYLKKH